LQTKMNWPQQGTLVLTEKEISIPIFQDFFSNSLPNIQIGEFNWNARWTHGAAIFSLRAAALFHAPEGTAISAALQATGNSSGLVISQFTAATGSETAFAGHGFLPLALEPAQKNILQWREKEKMDFQAASQPSAIFWREIANLTGVKMRSPKLDLNISGTLKSPLGKIILSADELDASPARSGQKIPHLEKLNANLVLNRDRIHLNELSLLVEGQPISAQAELPLEKDFSKDWKKAFDWRKARGQVAMTNAQIASFARLLPAILNPQGTINLNLNFAPGPQFQGGLKIENAATKSLASSGPLREVNAELKFNDRRIELGKTSGLLGGQPIKVTGKIDLEKEFKNGWPLIDLKILGENIPLARQPDLILRGDLDLAVANAKSEQPMISGLIKLRDSFYFGDLKPLIPGKIASPKRRPPYFSYETEPLASWKLGLKIQGDHFMKVRSPFFRGEISAGLTVEGTLKEPSALGVTKIEPGGTIQFPFANLRVNQGLISLLSDNPYRPQLFVTAASRTFGYDIRLEVGGYADEPTLEFSSTPALDSQQIILMMTAGEIPKKGFGFTHQQQASQLALFLGKSLLSKLGGDETAAERLTLSSGEDISTQGKQTYGVEYKLTEKLSVVGEYDRFGAFNAGMKWKVFSR
ncbi:MAG: translocation/assembly module TamB domain-containing protein, partial [Limisphaerales bacterium]